MNSPYAKNTTNADNYNQLSRTYACICKEILESKVDILHVRLGFYTFIPKSKINNFSYDIDSIHKQIDTRIEKYKKELKISEANSNYFEAIDIFKGKYKEISQKIIFRIFTWEDIIEFIKSNDSNFGNKLNNFYKICKKENRVLV